MKERIISSIIGLPLAIYAIITRGYLLLGLLIIIGIIGMYEFYKAFSIDSKILKGICYITNIVYFLLIGFGNKDKVIYLIGILLLALLIVYVQNYPKYNINIIMTMFYGVFYVTFLLSHIYLVREIPNYGMWIVWLIFIAAWGSDTFEYFTGISIGKHKIAPVLSPKKTLEGSIGGIIGAILLSVIYGVITVKLNDKSSNLIFYFALVGGIGSILSQIGDLAASAIKRNVEIKDFGKLIPGHGGILDRIDSILFTAPFVYIVLSLVLK